MKVEAAKIMRRIVKDANTFHRFNSAIGSHNLTVLDQEGNQLVTKLYGFNSSKLGMVLEITINGVMLERITVSRKNHESEYQTKYKYDFCKMYNIRSKEPVRAPVDEPTE